MYSMLISLMMIDSVFYPSSQKETQQVAQFVPYENVKLVQSKRLVGLAPAWCRYCPAAKARLPEVEWLAQDKYEGITPVQYPVVFDPETKVQVFGAALSSIDTVKSSIDAANNKYVKGYSKPSQSPVGKVEGGKEAVKMILLVVGKKGHFLREEKGIEGKLWGVKYKLPDNFEVNWKTESDTTQFVFLRKPSVNLIIVELTLSGVTLTPDRIKLNIDWLPDYPVDLE